MKMEEITFDLEKSLRYSKERDAAFDYWFDHQDREKYPEAMRQQFWMTWGTALVWQERKCW